MCKQWRHVLQGHQIYQYTLSCSFLKSCWMWAIEQHFITLIYILFHLWNPNVMCWYLKYLQTYHYMPKLGLYMHQTIGNVKKPNITLLPNRAIAQWACFLLNHNEKWMYCPQPFVHMKIDKFIFEYLREWKVLYKLRVEYCIWNSMRIQKLNHVTYLNMNFREIS